MVFKAVTRKGNVYELYTSDKTSSEDVELALDVTKKHPHHYKNRIVLNWEDFELSEVISLGLSPTQSNNTLGTTPPLNTCTLFPFRPFIYRGMMLSRQKGHSPTRATLGEQTFHIPFLTKRSEPIT